MNDLHQIKSERYLAGQAKFKEVIGFDAENFTASLDDIAPRLARYVMEWEFADMIGESSLNAHTREVVAISSLAMLGASATAILKLRIGTALLAGVTREEIIDVFVQLSLAAGLPIALSAIHLAKEKFSEIDSAPTPAA